MKLVLINPNRYRTPPVPPLALEYLAGSLEGTAHECRILDLCFADEPVDTLDSEIESFSPDIVKNLEWALQKAGTFNFLNRV